MPIRWWPGGELSAAARNPRNNVLMKHALANQLPRDVKRGWPASDYHSIAEITRVHLRWPVIPKPCCTHTYGGGSALLELPPNAPSKMCDLAGTGRIYPHREPRSVRCWMSSHQWRIHGASDEERIGVPAMILLVRSPGIRIGGLVWIRRRRADLGGNEGFAETGGGKNTKAGKAVCRVALQGGNGMAGTSAALCHE